MKHTLSVAIVTRNRSESLKRTLESLASQEPYPFEVLISDDSDLDDQINKNKKLAEKYSCKYHVGPGKGLYSNRNFIAKLCKGSHFRTMDDDHEFPENHFKYCFEAIQRDDKAIWVIGEYFPEDKERPIPAPIPGQLHPRGYATLPSDFSDYYAISCGATIYPKSVVEKNILNSEEFKFGILYLEYGARLKRYGYKIKHLSNTYVIHHLNENIGSSIAGALDKKSLNISNGARIYSMLMLSFKHRRTKRNQLLTIIEITKGLIKGAYSFENIREAYNCFKK